MTAFPSFPQIQSADLGEGELRVFVKREIINSGYEKRLASHKGMISLPAHAFWRLQSQTGEELRPLFGRSLLPRVLDQAFNPGRVLRKAEL